MIIYRVYNENGGYTEFSEEPQGVVFEIIDKTPTPEEIASQQAEILKQKETELYLKRMQDAQRIWAGLSAEFRIAKQVGQMDDATENIILAELKPVLDIVVPFGQWVTGYQLLLGIGSSVIGQPLYDKIHNILWSYIQENYEEMEVEQLKQSINKK
jgi:hypothetical protein